MQTDKNEKIAILGISENPSRYSFKAMKKLLESGYQNLYGISPKKPKLENIKVVSQINDLENDIHTLTIYLSKARSEEQIDNIIGLNPYRVIINPGAENENLEEKCKKKNIIVLRACTLVLLSSNQF